MTTQDPIQRRLILGLIAYEVVVITAVAAAGVSIATAGGSPVIAAVPVLVVAASEALRVPLSAWATRLTFFNRVIAILVLGCLAVASAEGLALSFDNLFQARTKVVADAAKGVDEARATLGGVEQQRAPLNAALVSAEQEIVALDTKHHALIDKPPVQPGFSGTICRAKNGAVRGCPADAAAQKSYAGARADYVKQIGIVEASRKAARESVAELQRQIASIDVALPTAAVRAAQRSLSDALEASPVHRIAASFYGIAATELSAQQFSTFRKYAVSGLSLALASMSALVAWLAFQTPRAAAPSKLHKALRAYIARHRKAVIRTVHVPSGTKVIYRYLPVNIDAPEDEGPAGALDYVFDDMPTKERRRAH
jgi:hypothetical protein